MLAWHALSPGLAVLSVVIKLGKRKNEDQKFKIILGYKAQEASLSYTQKKRGGEEKEEREARVKEGREILCVTTKTLIKQ